MVGSRSEDWRVHYPVSELAARYGASADADTSDPDEAYARFEPSRRAPRTGIASRGPSIELTRRTNPIDGNRRSPR
jgi:hypothetical protein